MDKEKITVIERPKTISWEEISSVLKRAHEENVHKGIVLPYPHLPPEVLKKKTEGLGGRIFVALYDGHVVATGAVAIIEKSFWCGKGKYAYCFLDAVLPKFAGKGLYGEIVKVQEEYARNHTLDRMMFDTDERNKRMLAISKRYDYRYVQYRVRDGHNSVVMVKWLNGCPYSRLKCALMFFCIKWKKIIASKMREL